MRKKFLLYSFLAVVTLTVVSTQQLLPMRQEGPRGIVLRQLTPLTSANFWETFGRDFPGHELEIPNQDRLFGVHANSEEERALYSLVGYIASDALLNGLNPYGESIIIWLMMHGIDPSVTIRFKRKTDITSDYTDLFRVLLRKGSFLGVFYACLVQRRFTQCQQFAIQKDLEEDRDFIEVTLSGDSSKGSDSSEFEDKCKRCSENFANLVYMRKIIDAKRKGTLTLDVLHPDDKSRFEQLVERFARFERGLRRSRRRRTQRHPTTTHSAAVLQRMRMAKDIRKRCFLCGGPLCGGLPRKLAKWSKSLGISGYPAF